MTLVTEMASLIRTINITAMVMVMVLPNHNVNRITITTKTIRTEDKIMVNKIIIMVDKVKEAQVILKIMVESQTIEIENPFSKVTIRNLMGMVILALMDTKTMHGFSLMGRQLECHHFI